MAMQSNLLLAFQQHEINAFGIYKRLARTCRNPQNKQTLERLSDFEWQHYLSAKDITKVEMTPNRMRVMLHYLVTRIFGLVFGIKLMEYYNKNVNKLNELLLKENPEYQKLMQAGEEKERLQISLLDEERLNYMSSIVLGLNDALIEFTGALAGFAFAFSNHAVVAMAGAIAGIAAALSMGASEYLSTKTEGSSRNAKKAAVYTTCTYLLTVSLLILPFVLLRNVYWGLAVCLVSGATVVGIFNFYYAVTRGESFWKRFFGMLSVSFSVATVSFIIGWLMKRITGINI